MLVRRYKIFRLFDSRAVALPLTLLLLALPIASQAQFDYTVTYQSATSATITITKYTGSGGEVVIPSAMDISGLMCPVVSIGDYAFVNANGANVTGVTIPNSITNIGAEAFCDCINLTSVTIPNSVIYLGGDAFGQCTGLQNLTIGINVTTIEDQTFWDCTSLASVTIPNSVTNIGNFAFDYCTSLMSATIGTNANIGGGAFMSCSNLANVTIPNGVGSIGNNSFASCTSLTNITIPSSVSSIADQAFQGCTKLKSVYFLGNAPNVGSAVFTNDPATAYYLPGTIGWGSTFAGIPVVLLSLPFTCTATNSGITIIGYLGSGGIVAIPPSINNQPVVSIAPNAFADCTTITSVTIPGVVQTIGSEAFYACNNLTNVTMSDGTTTIGVGAFENCSDLISIIIPNSVTNIPDAAFESCYKLTSVTVGSGVVNIGAAFGSCPWLTSVYFWGNAPTVYPLAFDGDPEASVFYLPGTTGWSSAFAGCTTKLWFLPSPIILGGASFGIRTNQFGFLISWATNVPVVIEACTNLNGAWIPLQTNSLNNGSSYFSDPQWAGYSRRFYRICLP